MITHPVFIIVFLLLVEAAVLYAAGHPRFKKYFQFLPSVFWIYFLPMLASTVGLIDEKSPIYQKIITHFLPASLVLLLIPIDIKAIMRLGPTAIMMFFAGSFGIMMGTVLVFGLFKQWVGDEFWSGFGALSASWTGGSANMIAVKEAIATPEHIFAPMVVVDTIVPYVWMGFMVAMSGSQALYDRWNGSDRNVLDDLAAKVSGTASDIKKAWRWEYAAGFIVVALMASLGLQRVARLLPVVENVISVTAWTIILVTLLGIGLSFTRVRQMEHFGMSRVGYFLLYFVLTAIGAKASLSHLNATLLLILAGFLIVLFHSFILIIASKLLRAPMFLVAVASQANVGGVASTPIVAEIYQPGLASVGLLLAILGNICGTYLGIITSQLCRWVAGAI